MRIRRWLFSAVFLGLAAAGAYAAYQTQDKWLPHVFPTKAEAKAVDSHEGHDHGRATTA